MDHKKEIVRKYEGKIMGVYDSLQMEDVMVGDLLSEEKLVRFMADMAEREISITKDGFAFLEEYYGLNELVLILKAKNPRLPYDGTDLREWLLTKKEFAIDA